ENEGFNGIDTVIHVILTLTDCPPCYSLPHTLSSMLFYPSQTVLHVILSLTDCPPCYSLPHRLSSMLLSPTHTVLYVILSLTDCPSCYSLPHRLLSSILFSPSHTVLHVILSLTDCPPCYSLPHSLSSMLFCPSQIVLHLHFMSSELPTLALEDFNIPINNPTSTSASQLLSLTTSLDLSQLSTSETHKDGNTLDLEFKHPGRSSSPYHQNLQTAERSWRKTRTPEDFIHFKFMIKTYNSALHIAKQTYFTTLNSSLSNNPKKLFDTFHSLLRPKAQAPITEICVDDLASQFIEKIDNIHQEIRSQSPSSVSPIPPCISPGSLSTLIPSQKKKSPGSSLLL
ncbi:unnamed protein product, partial [Ranitomeya imitator]